MSEEPEKKLYRVSLETEVVVLAEDEGNALSVAESHVSDIDNWRTDVNREVKTAQDLPQDWDPDTLPWGLDYGVDKTIAQIWEEGEDEGPEAAHLRELWGEIRTRYRKKGHRVFWPSQFTTDEIDKGQAEQLLLELTKAEEKFNAFVTVYEDGEDIWRGPIDEFDQASWEDLDDEDAYTHDLQFELDEPQRGVKPKPEPEPKPDLTSIGRFDRLEKGRIMGYAGARMGYETIVRLPGAHEGQIREPRGGYNNTLVEIPLPIYDGGFVWVEDDGYLVQVGEWIYDAKGNPRFRFYVMKPRVPEFAGHVKDKERAVVKTERISWVQRILRWFK